jgi:hypothetical protein
MARIDTGDGADEEIGIRASVNAANHVIAGVEATNRE